MYSRKQNWRKANSRREFRHSRMMSRIKDLSKDIICAAGDDDEDVVMSLSVLGDNKEEIKILSSPPVVQKKVRFSPVVSIVYLVDQDAPVEESNGNRRNKISAASLNLLIKSASTFSSYVLFRNWCILCWLQNVFLTLLLSNIPTKRKTSGTNSNKYNFVPLLSQKSVTSSNDICYVDDQNNYLSTGWNKNSLASDLLLMTNYMYADLYFSPYGISTFSKDDQQYFYCF